MILNVLETVMESSEVQKVNSYSIFTFASMHNLHQGISKLVKNCTVRCLSSDGLSTSVAPKGGTLFTKTRAQVLRERSPLLSAIESNRERLGARVDFPNERPSNG